jgi:hypothetical protein
MLLRRGVAWVLFDEGRYNYREAFRLQVSSSTHCGFAVFSTPNPIH